jgi:hypothetical protein
MARRQSALIAGSLKNIGQVLRRRARLEPEQFVNVAMGLAVLRFTAGQKPLPPIWLPHRRQSMFKLRAVGRRHR